MKTIRLKVPDKRKDCKWTIENHGWDNDCMDQYLGQVLTVDVSKYDNSDNYVYYEGYHFDKRDLIIETKVLRRI